MAQKLPNSGDPDSEEFSKGPEIGQSVPEFTLPNQWSKKISYQPDGVHSSLILFHRSADW